MTTTVAHSILTKIKEENISHVFVVPGKNIVPFLSAMDDLENDITGVICASELGAGFMADGYSRATNNFGTVITISGPGFNNLYGAIVNAYYDHSKLLILCGSPNAGLAGKNSFQDSSLYKLDCSVIASTLCYYSCNLNVRGLQHQLSNTFFSLKNHKMPTFVQVPVDIQMEQSDITIDTTVIDKQILNYSAVCQIENIIKTKKQFFIVTGSRAVEHAPTIRKFSTKYHIPVASTLCSKGVVPENADYYLGIFGFGMSPRVHHLLNDDSFEYVITMGMDLTERNTAQWSTYIGKHIIHLDSVISENSRDYDGISDAYITNISLLLEHLQNNIDIDTTLNTFAPDRIKLLSGITSSTPYMIPIEHKNENALYVDQVVKFLNMEFYHNANVVVDSGSHRLYCAHLWRTYESDAYFTSINNGHMGWAVAASIGIKLGDSKKDCICITGDGCMLMNGTEIQTAAKYNIKVFFVVLNNNAHGAMSSNRLSKNSYQIPNHDWASFGMSLGVNSISVKSIADLEYACRVYMESDGPMLIDVKCNYDDNVALNKYYNNPNVKEDK